MATCSSVTFRDDVDDLRGELLKLIAILLDFAWEMLDRKARVWEREEGSELLV